MDKKGDITFFRWRFLSQVTENIVGEPFCVSEMFWYQKFLDNRGITFLPIFFCLTSPKIIVEEPFCVSELLWFQSLLDNRGITILSIVLFLSHSAEKFVENPPMIQKN